jgi:MFS family permease
MTKSLFIMLALTFTAKEAAVTGDFPLSGSELWQLLFVFLAALFTSLSNEASKRREGETFVLMRFLGDVGLGVMAGMCIPLLITWAFEHLTKTTTDWRASVGLSILGAYIGRDALQWAWSMVKSASEFVGRLKGMKISFDGATPPADPPPPPPPTSPGGDDHA